MSLRKTEEALALLATFIEDSGPCEHAVNICVCGEKQVHADALAEVEALKTAAVVMFGRVNGDAMDSAVDTFRSIADENEKESNE